MGNLTNSYATTPVSEFDATKVATYNAALQVLDSAINGRLPISTTGGTTTLTGTPAAPQAQNLFLDVSGTLTSNATIEIPIAAGTGRNRLYIVRNGTTGAFTLTVKKVGGTGVAVAQSAVRLLYYNDTDIDYADAGAGGGSGDFSSNTSTSVDSEIVLFSGTAGKTGKRATGSGIAKLTSGVLSAVTEPSGSLVGTTATQTLTNKRNQPRVYTVADTATLTPEIDTYDVFHVTALAQAITIANHSTSTPADGEQMRIRLLDNGTGRAITWGTNYVAKGGVALPSTTTSNKNLECGLEWNANLSKWNLLAVAQEA